MTGSHGKFCWYELMTIDTAAAQDFYRAVMGWEMKDSGMPGMAYTILHAGPVPMGGLMAIPAEAAGMEPCWVGYIAVDDVDATAERVRKAGGTIARAPADIPEVGRFAVVTDPQKALLVLFRGDGEPPPAPPGGAPGHAGWRELRAADGAAAFPFYAELFGWAKGEAMDMGPMGVYQIFTIDGEMAGGMMTRPPGAPGPAWLYYFNTDAIDAAAARVRDHGGQVLLEPTEVPGGAWIIQCRDPQGAFFALVGPRR